MPSDDVLEARIMSKVTVTPSGCWEYGGARHKRTGHGMFGVTVDGKGKTWYVHKWLYEKHIGAVPVGLVLDHVECDNPPCCNYEHVAPANIGENVLRGTGKSAVNARKVKCHNGHELTGENVYLRKRGHRTERHCKQCARDRRVA